MIQGIGRAVQRGGSRSQAHRRPGEIRHRGRRDPLVVHVPRREPLLPRGEFLSGETGQYQRPLVLVRPVTPIAFFDDFPDPVQKGR